MEEVIIRKIPLTLFGKRGSPMRRLSVQRLKNYWMLRSNPAWSPGLMAYGEFKVVPIAMLHT